MIVRDPLLPGHEVVVGLEGIRVDDPDALGAAWDQALAAERPVLVEALTDPEVPPLPPHITLQEAKYFMRSVVRGDPDRGAFIKQSLKQKVEEFIPGR